MEDRGLWLNLAFAFLIGGALLAFFSYQIFKHKDKLYSQETHIEVFKFPFLLIKAYFELVLKLHKPFECLREVTESYLYYGGLVEDNSLFDYIDDLENKIDLAKENMRREIFSACLASSIYFILLAGISFICLGSQQNEGDILFTAFTYLNNKWIFGFFTALPILILIYEFWKIRNLYKNIIRKEMITYICNHFEPTGKTS